MAKALFWKGKKMENKRMLEATATKGGKWWNIAIPELEQITATKKLGEVQEYANSLAAAILDVSVDSVHVNIAYALPETARAEWEAARAQTLRAKELTMEAAARTKIIVRQLHDSGYTVRDIEKVLGISFQRVAQILKTA